MSLGITVLDVTDGTGGASKNVRKPDSKADVPVWTSTATRPTWLGGYRTRHSPDRSGAEGRTTHHMLNRCTGAASVPRYGKRCVLCQRLPSTTTSGNRPVLSKRALIVHAILPDAVLRFRRTGRATGRQAVTSGTESSESVVGSQANGNAGLRPTHRTGDTRPLFARALLRLLLAQRPVAVHPGNQEQAPLTSATPPGVHPPEPGG